MTHGPDTDTGNHDSSAALKRARQAADGATTFGIIAFVLGVIATTQHELGAAAIAMGALGLIFVWRGSPNHDDEVSSARSVRNRQWRQSAAIFSTLGIVLGAVGAVQAIAS